VFIEEGESAKTTQRKRLIEMLAYCRIARPRIDAPKEPWSKPLSRCSTDFNYERRF